MRVGLPRCTSCPERPSRGSPEGQERAQRLYPEKPLNLQLEQNARLSGTLQPHPHRDLPKQADSATGSSPGAGNVEFKHQTANISKEMAGESLICSFFRRCANGILSSYRSKESPSQALSHRSLDMSPPNPFTSLSNHEVVRSDGTSS